MVYISSDGQIHQGSRSWGVKKIVDTFFSFLDGVGLFVQTLLPFSVPIPRAIGSGRSNRSSTSVGNNNFQSGRRGGNGPSNRPMGGFRTMSDIRPPPPTTCCAGGGCGM